MQRKRTRELAVKMTTIEVADLLSPHSLDGVDPVCRTSVNEAAG